MKFTNLLYKSVRNACHNQDSGSSRQGGKSNKRHGMDAFSSRGQGAMLCTGDADSNDTPKDGVTMSIPAITLNDDEVPLMPTNSLASDPFADPPSDPFADPPGSVPQPLELDLSDLMSNAAALKTVMDHHAQRQVSTRTPAGQTHPFRVVIVGAGATGLALAHALHHAGIDYVLLERMRAIILPTTTPDNSDNNNAADDYNNDGTGLIIWPHAARILDQLGLLRAASRLSTTIHKKQAHRADGSACGPLPGGADVFSRSRADHGRACMLISRGALLKVLWEGLPERDARVRVGREVVSVETDDAGARVTCTDGGVVCGSVVVGCDGVEGVVRRAVGQMRAEKKRLARKTFSLGLGLGGGANNDCQPSKDMAARYYGLVGSAPLLDGLEQGVVYEMRGDSTGKTFQVLAGEETAYFLAYLPLHRPSHRHTKYPPQNAAYLASALSQHPVTGRVKFGDLWGARRRGSRMVDFHEGMAEKWYHGRVALLGGAAHTMTPVLGFGFSTGLQGAAELANGLRRLLFASSALGNGGGVPGASDIKRTLKAYQMRHDDAARRAVLISSFYNRAIAAPAPGPAGQDQDQKKTVRVARGALDTFYGWAAAPSAVGEFAMLERQAAWAVRLGVTLEYAGERHFRAGRLRWAHPRRRVGADGGVSTSAEDEEEQDGEDGVGRTVWVHPGVPLRVRGTFGTSHGLGLSC